MSKRCSASCRGMARRIALGSVALVVLASTAPAAEPIDEPVLSVLGSEVDRAMGALADEPDPPYFLSYEVTDIDQVTIDSAFGTLTNSRANRRRQLDIDVRVGDYEFDNTRPVRGGSRMFGMFDRFSFVALPIEDDPEALRQLLWFHTDSKYRRAVEQWIRVKTNVQVKVEQEDQSADFSREDAVRHVGDVAELELDRGAWEERLRELSAAFAEHPEIYLGRASLQASAEVRWYADSSGSRIRSTRPIYRLAVFAITKADDGMELPRFETYHASTAAGLPSQEAVLADVETMIDDLLALREAPLVDPYTGPAILSGRASGVFFHEIFGHRVEGHRQKQESDGQTFKKKVGEQILPETFSVAFDPTLRNYAGEELVGHYLFDNQGVPARRVEVVEDGVFKTFLMSRTPIEDFPISNGHGRRQPGFGVVARQSNLVVEVSHPVSEATLEQRLLERIREEGKPFGLIFEDIQGGFTMTGRTMPNTFNVLPILVYRLHADGRKELVRGVDLIGTPLTAFSKILAADDKIEVFNGTCGAESGGVPVSASSPGILVSQIEVQKKSKSQERIPVLPAPTEPDVGPVRMEGGEG